MLNFETVIPAGQGNDGPITETLGLPHALRARSRQRVTLPSGREAGLFLPRGTVLRHGDLLLAADGETVRVEAVPEYLSRVRCPDARALGRACCHLGNRHAPMQIGPDFVQYPADRVLDNLISGLGLTVEHLCAPFEPESSALPQIQVPAEGVRFVIRP